MTYAVCMHSVNLSARHSNRFDTCGLCLSLDSNTQWPHFGVLYIIMEMITAIFSPDI